MACQCRGVLAPAFLTTGPPMFERLITGRDINTSLADTVHPTDGVKTAIDLLCTHRIRRMPVVDVKCHRVGLISGRNPLQSLSPKRQEFRQAGARASSPGAERIPTFENLFEKDIMAHRVITARLDAEPLRPTSTMALRKIRREDLDRKRAATV